MRMNLESHDFMRFKDMGLLKYYNLNLIEKKKDSNNRPYLNRTQKTENSENVCFFYYIFYIESFLISNLKLVSALSHDYVKLLEKQKLDLDHKDIEIKNLKQDNEKVS
jgi:hypothetical protein